MRATASYEPEVDFRKKTTSRIPDDVFYGPPLVELPTTRQVHFFYQQFGRGAVVETLQRLGSGQNIDQALYATTGLNQQQFMARWQVWDSAQPAASADEEAAPNEDAEPHEEAAPDEDNAPVKEAS